MADEIMLGGTLTALRLECALSADALARRLHTQERVILYWEDTQVPPRFIPVVKRAIAAAQREKGR